MVQRLKIPPVKVRVITCARKSLEKRQKRAVAFNYKRIKTSEDVKLGILTVISKANFFKVFTIQMKNTAFS